jgi:uncharacterized protein (DUF305 family)
MEQHTQKSHGEHNRPYIKLFIMPFLSFIAMYILMYAMVNSGANVLPNTNQFYMAGLMAMPMIFIEVLLMKSMYKDKRLNMIVIGISILAMTAFYFAIRKQAAINDKQFLKSMIPHHAGAILMCDEADITDPEIKKLCEEIIASQKKEIEQMKSKLAEINK